MAVGYATCPRVLPSVAVHLAADRAASPLLATLAAPWGARKSPLCLALGLLAPQPMTLIHPFPRGGLTSHLHSNLQEARDALARSGSRPRCDPHAADVASSHGDPRWGRVTRSGQCEKLVPTLSGPLVGEGIRSYALLDFEFLPKHITEPM